MCTECTGHVPFLLAKITGSKGAKENFSLAEDRRKIWPNHSGGPGGVCGTPQP